MHCAKSVHSLLLSTIEDSSSEDDAEYMPLDPGARLDEKRYSKYHRSLKPKLGVVAPSAYMSVYDYC